MKSVRYGSNVVLYGAGNNGREFYNQNQIISWCNILYAVDNNCENIEDFPIDVYSIDDMQKRNDYDQILISILSYEIRKKVIQELCERGIQRNRIIADIDQFLMAENGKEIIERNTIETDSAALRIGFLPGGVMGDNVISLRLYQEIVRLAGSCYVDVFTTFEGFPEHVFYGQKNLRKIIHRHPDERDKDEYDLIIQSHFEPSLLYCNIERVERLNNDFAKRIKQLYNYQTSDFFMCSPAQYMNRIQWDRAKFKGYTCYTILGSSGAFDIDDSNVYFPLDDDFAELFSALGLDAKYITFSYGASDPLRNGKSQTKIWPKKHYEHLLMLLKKGFPNVELVQLDADGVPRVNGADRYIMGENLETVKYVLKNAMCHIDNEGGLVHIATQLGTKCFVIFGPTPVGFFGYKENVNIVSEECRECCGLVPDWYTRCYKYETPKCMESIISKKVYTEVRKYLYTKV